MLLQFRVEKNEAKFEGSFLSQQNFKTIQRNFFVAGSVLSEFASELLCIDNCFFPFRINFFLLVRIQKY